MEQLPPRYDARAVEQETRSYWASRSLPSSDGALGVRSGPTVHQIVGSAMPIEPIVSLLQRAVLADVDARYLILAGRRTSATMFFRSPWAGTGPAETSALLARCGIWNVTGAPKPAASADRAPLVQEIVGRLAEARLLVARELPLRTCPRCRSPRSPEAIVYQTEEGTAYLVRFPLTGVSPPTSLVVWTDTLWKLLGTSAILINPDLPYVLAKYSRRGAEERIVVARSALDRLRGWLPDASLEVVEERPGATWAGTPYVHPLATEYPPVTALLPPAGTIVASHDVGDSGTALVALVPAHGAADAMAALSLSIPGWPVLGTDGALDRTLHHKYTGLPLDAAESFIQRDLADGGFLFAQLSVRRGVPHCAVCGTTLLWVPSRAWCLEPGRLPPESLGQFARLLPDEGVPLAAEIVPWPVTGGTRSEDGLDPVLSECSACDRLASATTGARCPCGGTLVPVRRTLLPPVAETFHAWAREAPNATGDSVRLYVTDRRRGPALIHHLAAREGRGVRPADLRLVSVPTLVAPTEGDDVLGPDPIDAWRLALVRTADAPRGASTFADRRAQEARRLRKFWQLLRAIVGRMVADGYRTDAAPIVSHLAELTEEDRAFLSSFERLRLDVLRDYDRGAIAQVAERLGRFMETDLRAGYCPMVQARLNARGASPEKAAAYRILLHVLTSWVELAAPLAPFTMEAAHRSLRGSSSSVFERTFTPIQEIVLDANAEATYSRWRSVVEAVDSARAELGLAPGALVPSVVLLARDPKVAEELRRSVPVLQRIAGITSLEVPNDEHPWEGKRVEAVPVPSEIQKVYGLQAPRIIRILSSLSPRRVQEGLKTGALSIALEGATLRILPSMVELSESLPEDTIPVPWGFGELLVQTSPTAGAAAARIPALSLEGFRVVRMAARHLRRAAVPTGRPPTRVVLCVRGPLSSELARQATAIARFLGVASFEVTAGEDGFVAAETERGRLSRGEPWSLWIPGRPAPAARAKHRRVKLLHARVRPVADLLLGGPGEVDFLDEALRAKEAQVRSTVERFDTEFGLPVMGPTKVALAWDAGYPTFDAIVHAPYEALTGIPGFGPVLAGEVVRKFGGTVPERPPRYRAAPAGSPAIEPPNGGTAPPSEGAARSPSLPEVPLLATQVLPTVFPPAVDPLPAIVAPPAPPPPSPSPPPADGIPGPSREIPVEGNPARGASPVDLPLAPAQIVPPDGPPVGPPPSLAGPVAAPSSSGAEIPSPVLAEDEEPPPPPIESSPALVEEPSIAAPAPAVTPEPPPPPEPAAGLELWPAESEEAAWSRFLEATGAGHRGICLSREFPDRRRAMLGRRDVEIIWLTNQGRGNTVRPSDPVSIDSLLRKGLAERNVAAIYIEGVEYLSRVNGTERIVALLQGLEQEARAHRARIWVPVNPGLLAPADLDALRGAFRVGNPPE